MAKALHSMIRMVDEARSVGICAASFGRRRAERLAFDGFTRVCLRNDKTECDLELTVTFIPDPGGSRIELLQRGGRHACPPTAYPLDPRLRGAHDPA